MTITFQNNLRMTTLILYRLKRMFGVNVIFHQVTANTNNVQTGAQTQTTTDLPIKKALVLPDNLARKFAYDLAYIAANKNFTYGGFFDRASRIIILDTKDLNGLVPTLNDHVTIQGEIWNIKQLSEAENSKGYLCQVVRVTSE